MFPLKVPKLCLSVKMLNLLPSAPLLGPLVGKKMAFSTIYSMCLFDCQHQMINFVLLVMIHNFHLLSTSLTCFQWVQLVWCRLLIDYRFPGWKTHLANQSFVGETNDASQEFPNFRSLSVPGAQYQT